MSDRGLKALTVTDEILTILRDIPGSVRTILQEMLQNAGDAGADVFEIELHYPHALVVRNNAEFTLEDLDSWERIRDSGKRNRPTTLGSKGCGAKSMFHFADIILITFSTSAATACSTSTSSSSTSSLSTSNAG